MPVFLFRAANTGRDGRPQFLQPGMSARWTVLAPNAQVAQNLSRQLKLGEIEQTNYGIRYEVVTIDARDQGAAVLAVEKVVANISNQSVHAGQTLPQGQRGMDRPPGERHSSGFQALPDLAMEVGDPYAFTPPDVSTYTDLVQNGNAGSQEIQRGDTGP